MGTDDPRERDDCGGFWPFMLFGLFILTAKPEEGGDSIGRGIGYRIWRLIRQGSKMRAGGVGLRADRLEPQRKANAGGWNEAAA